MLKQSKEEKQLWDEWAKSVGGSPEPIDKFLEQRKYDLARGLFGQVSTLPDQRQSSCVHVSLSFASLSIGPVLLLRPPKGGAQQSTKRGQQRGREKEKEGPPGEDPSHAQEA